MQPNEDAALEALTIALGNEAKLNTLMQGLLMLVIRHYAAEGVTDRSISIKAFEAIRDFTRMTSDE